MSIQFYIPKWITKSGSGFISLTLGITLSGLVYAESDKKTAASEYVLEVNGQKDKHVSLKAELEKWNKSRQAKITSDDATSKANYVKPEDLSKKQSLKLNFPAPPAHISGDASEYLGHKLVSLLIPIAELLLPTAAEAATTYGTTVVDGNLSDWTINDRINLPLDKPPYLATGSELYAKFVNGTNPVYIFAIKASGTPVGSNTTLFLNTDQNANTGFKIWGSYSGAEYSINIYTDGSANLYDSNFAWKSALEYAYSADKSSIEIVVPAAALSPLVVPQSINVMGDINDTLLLFPEDYVSGGQYTVLGVPEVLPVRTDLSKRVGIVFSDPSKANFYNEKAYSQLYMALQHQAMMAGIGFDLLSEGDLTDIKKLVNYDALIFPYASNISKSQLTQIRKTLYTAIYKYGIGIITADNWLTNDETNTAIAGDSYQIMKQLLGITRESGAGPAAIDLVANTVTHPAMKGYTAGESILSSTALNSYKSTYTSYYVPIPGQTVTTLANQVISGVGTKPGVLANTTGGRNVHFASAGLMADGPLVWQALQWIVYGTQTPVALKMGRNANIFISRNDMDQSQEFGNSYYDNMGNVDVPLYTLLSNWKNAYNFVGSYYINIGNAAPDQQTIWNSTPASVYDSGPLYKKYIALGNEIGTHSYTHPQDTNVLTAEQIEFEFNQSMNQIGSQLNPTWQNQNVRGAAVPGMPEGLVPANTMMQYLDYLSGGGSNIGAGYPSAIGYLSPSHSKVYFSPNMSFDFTLMDFGVPKGTPPVPVRLSAADAEQYWAAEYDRLMKHAAQPIVHWPWHDYGPTSATTAASGQGYTVAMFQNTIARAFNTGAEFTTLADATQRINTFKNAKLTVSQTGSQYTATVASANVGKFSLALNLATGQKIQRVTNWYAYNDDKVFLSDNGGSYVIQTGTVADNVTHITELPMRSRLISATGDGKSLNFSFEGEGSVKVALSDLPSLYQVTSDGGVLSVNLTTKVATLKFATFGVHTVSLKLGVAAITVYQNYLYLGTAQQFGVGAFASTSGMFDIVGNDTISSIKVAAGYSVLACQNADGSGTCVTLTASSSILASTINDRISYLVIKKI